ncbi:diaminopimelate decarboxylase [Caldalkalibacillus uzonensis]|uniref:Diaminopimelate decarboxylase n=1 Tax=Caldalkalibacillus uzonensis TaxID=353224 RepID=A0ABU0CRZ8_9BACI|nr:diaminopimelate decarboxylase [Caldalkalibacillus uzonensis]MDQ0339170.1 diaminopimelate decarboxylase [Caldalkalibacillus uzonensis]
MVLYGTSRINERGHLEIGGCDVVELAEAYGTPLMIYDEVLIRRQCRAFVQAFQDKGMKAQVAYASKAFSSVAMCQLIEEEGLSLDVVSGGELYTALKAGFPPERIHFHGNNKSPEELNMALEAGIGCFVVDNFTELAMLHTLAEARKQQVKILLRITPGVEAHTHDYIATGQEDSKFGFDLNSGQALQALKQAVNQPYYHVLGLHAHIGSQIFDTKAFQLVIQRLAGFVQEAGNELGWPLSVLNLGGGFGIRYTREDTPLSPQEYVYALCDGVKQEWQAINQPLPEVWIEPGRSIVGEAGTTVYTIGAHKEVPGVRQYISVDGGMSDNLRVALYQAKYEACLANRMTAERSEVYTVAGKLCETGDILIWDLPLPPVKQGDLLAVFCTGAYGYSMANNYNRIPRPAVVMTRDSEAHLIIQRESYEDLLRLDVPLVSKVTQK